MNHYIVPLNTSTINSQSPPIAQTNPYEGICAIDGWYWDNTLNNPNPSSGDGVQTTNKCINWTVYPKNNNSTGTQISPYVNRIYFNCYLLKDPSNNVSAVPSLNITLAGSVYNGTIAWSYSSALTSGLYTFVADIGSTTTQFGNIYNNGGDIIKLTYTSGTPLSTLNVTAESIQQVAVVTTVSSTTKYMFILSNVFIEVNDGSSIFGGTTDVTSAYTYAGVYDYTFLSSTVKQLYFERALDYLFGYWFKMPPGYKVSPIFDGTKISGSGQTPSIYDIVPSVTDA